MENAGAAFPADRAVATISSIGNFVTADPVFCKKYHAFAANREVNPIYGAIAAPRTRAQAKPAANADVATLPMVRAIAAGAALAIATVEPVRA
jgi:hypothetical protein